MKNSPATKRLVGFAGRQVRTPEDSPAVDDDDDGLTSTPTSHSPVFSMIGCIGDTLARARTARVSMGASKKVSAAMMPSKPSPSPLPCTRKMGVKAPN